MLKGDSPLPRLAGGRLKLGAGELGIIDQPLVLGLGLHQGMTPLSKSNGQRLSQALNAFLGDGREHLSTPGIDELDDA